jgi:hypothetical protein
MNEAWKLHNMYGMSSLEAVLRLSLYQVDLSWNYLDKTLGVDNFQSGVFSEGKIVLRRSKCIQLENIMNNK